MGSAPAQFELDLRNYVEAGPKDERGLEKFTSI